MLSYFLRGRKREAAVSEQDSSEQHSFAFVEFMDIADVHSKLREHPLNYSDHLASRVQEIIATRRAFRREASVFGEGHEVLDSLSTSSILPQTVKRSLASIFLVSVLGLLGLSGAIGAIYFGFLENAESRLVAAFVTASSSLLVICSLIAAMLVLWQAFIYKHIEALKARDAANLGGDLSYAFAEALVKIEFDPQFCKTIDSFLLLSRQRTGPVEQERSQFISSLKTYFLASDARLQALIKGVEAINKARANQGLRCP